MILGSLESQRRALQDHAEKHHSPEMEDKAKCRKIKLSKNEQSVNPPTYKTQQDIHQDSVLYDLGLVSKIITSPKRSCMFMRACEGERVH